MVDAPTKGQTIEGIFNDLKARKTAQGTINIVSHAVGFGAIEGPITLADRAAGRTMTIADDMQDALANKTLAPPGPGIITDKTRIVLYGCDVGRSVNYLKLLSGLFGNPGELLTRAATERVQAGRHDGQVSPGAKLDAGAKGAADPCRWVCPDRRMACVPDSVREGRLRQVQPGCGRRNRR